MNSDKSNKWGRIAILFFEFMIVLTIFSRAASNAIRAKVTVTKPVKQTILHNQEIYGSISPKDYFIQYVDAGLIVKSVQVVAGQRVEKGDVLFTVDVKRLKDEIAKNDAITVSAEMKKYLDGGGKYKAEKSGLVSRIMVEAGERTTDGVAVMIAEAAGDVYLTAELSWDALSAIRDDSQFILNAGSNMEMVYNLSDVVIGMKEGASYEDAYTLTMTVPGEVFPVGSSVSVLISNKSETFSYCIPLRCLRMNAEGQYFVYLTEEQDTVLGKELVAKEMIVTVLDKNSRYAAIEGSYLSGRPIIESVNKVISDGSRVKIIE